MEKKIFDYPIYDVVVDPDSEAGAYCFSLVVEAASEINMLALKSEVETENIFLAQQDRQELWGALLVPDKLITRKPTKLIPVAHYIRFTKEQIEIIADKFNESSNNNCITFMHKGIPVEGFLKSNWIIDSPNDKSIDKGFNLNLGTWFGVLKLKSQDFWQKEIKSGNLKGISPEISFDGLVKINLALEETVAPITNENISELDFLKDLLNDLDISHL